MITIIGKKPFVVIAINIDVIYDNGCLCIGDKFTKVV